MAEYQAKTSGTAISCSKCRYRLHLFISFYMPNTYLHSWTFIMCKRASVIEFKSIQIQAFFSLSLSLSLSSSALFDANSRQTWKMLFTRAKNQATIHTMLCLHYVYRHLVNFDVKHNNAGLRLVSALRYTEIIIISTANRFASPVKSAWVCLFSGVSCWALFDINV